ncbi:MAG: acetylornithine deacetylase [Myxococcota bacterium]
MPQVVEDLTRLVAFPSVSDRALDDLAAWLAARLEDLGFTVDRFPDPTQPGKSSLIASIGPKNTDGLVLSGHMDVVPVADQPWTSDPFRLVERDGRLFGRGAADMKGFFAATLGALARIPRQAYRRELVLIWTHDEEVGCLGSAVLVDALAGTGRTFPSACLIGEPTDFQVLRMHPGHVAIELEVTGRSAHSSRPDLGINAIEGASRLVSEAVSLAKELGEEHADIPELERPWVALNVASIHGGTAVNIVPDRCSIRVGYRPLPGMGTDEVFERMIERVPTDLKSRTVARVLRRTPALLTPAGTPLEGELAEHALHHAVGAASFATDGGNLARLGMLPLVFGPGSITVAHQPDEYIPVDQLVRAVDVIEGVVRRRCCARG